MNGYFIKRTYLPKRIQKLPSNIRNKVNTKKLSYELAYIVRDYANKYIPENTGKLKTKGVLIQTANSKTNPWFKISYRNTKSVPYVMYQYYGEVWGPNYPTFSLGESFNPEDLTMRSAKMKHTGWISPKVKHNTGRPFRRRKKTVTLRKGMSFTITGYTKNKKAKPKWLEEVANEAYKATGYYDTLCQKVELTYAEILRKYG